MPFYLLPNGQGNFVNALARLLFLIRPLSLLGDLAGPHDILSVIPAAMRPLGDLFCLFCLFLVIIAILCISLFGSGKLHGRCVVAADNRFAQALEMCFL